MMYRVCNYVVYIRKRILSVIMTLLLFAAIGKDVTSTCEGRGAIRVSVPLYSLDAGIEFGIGFTR